MNILDYKIIDLTHSLSSDAPSWDGSCGFSLETQIDYQDCHAPDLFRVQKIVTRAGMGTHVDAPAHCFCGGKTIDLLQLETLITDCLVIKVDHVADENYVVMPEEVDKFEKEYGEIKAGSFVIFYTGWDRFWGTPAEYRNNLKFPSVHEKTAQLLLERQVAGLGIDTLSPDARGDTFPVHRVILGAGKYIVENVANANELPATGAKIFVLPMKIKEGTEAPVRLVAMVSENP